MVGLFLRKTPCGSMERLLVSLSGRVLSMSTGYALVWGLRSCFWAWCVEFIPLSRLKEDLDKDPRQCGH